MTKTLNINGSTFEFVDGESLLEVAQRNGIGIPTLCHDPRLKAVGACRTCLVEVEGQRRLTPACATLAAEGAKVTTDNARIARHRQLLLSMYLADHPIGQKNRGDDELLEMAERFAATPLGALRSARPGRSENVNPYIKFDAERCILCARCVRYCEEVEGVQAITLAGRGSLTTISTADARGLLDSSCELCGGCVDVCPTGAMSQRAGWPLLKSDTKKVRTTCNYCGVGCQMDLVVDPDANDGRGHIVRVDSPGPGTTTNDGNLCVKGRFGTGFVDHPDRLTVPLIRGEDGELHEATWEQALDRVVKGFAAVQEAHGKDALGFVSSSRCTVEENYLVQKLARAVYGTNNVHQCAAT
ncbi:MAG: hypothetical protein AUK47_26245 [Deltaproteobacteria bacterium CG2_30_63_29]|nr:MAG: hypothetical protein AUK47_26245 [Deltaproteobacteria bacterium CG2_30_63_29]PJB49176.1 MAG: hypothetical protein CO108_00650 [Deltaproteobacteria bacterium CG_4_9_14_3_um_filter_63_12]